MPTLKILIQMSQDAGSAGLNPGCVVQEKFY